MKQLQVNRRQFMQLALGVGAAWVVGTQLHTPTTAAQHPLLAQLANLLPHQQSARLIGQHYLARYPQERALDPLLSELTSSLNMIDTSSLPLQLTQQISTDFATEKVVKLQGWVLSRTEARLCALAALVQS